MKIFSALPKLLALLLALLIAAAGAWAKEPEWRTWTSGEGAEIEAYLKEVRPEGLVIVRRDGREFTAPASRFSAEDRAYVTAWLEAKLPSATEFRGLDFTAVELPNRYTIENVQNVRPTGREPVEAGAIRTILQFHDIPAGTELAEALAARKQDADLAIPPRDLINALGSLPVEAEIIIPRPGQEGAWQIDQAAIQTAITWNLPVIVAYRPLMEPETPEEVGVAVGFDRRNLFLLEPRGGRSPNRLDLRDFEFQFAYAVILFPQAQPLAHTPAAEEAEGPPQELLSRISSLLREASSFDPEAVVATLEEAGLRVTLRDVNRSDYRTQLGQTRSFARSGGLPLIDASLDGGNVVIAPVETGGGTGLALLYGRTDDGYRAVEFAPDQTFRRAPVSRADLARRWITRVDRTYRLDMIEITVRR